MSRTLRRGLSDEIGSWNTSWSRVRTERSSLPDSSVRSVPPKRTRPEVGGGSWTMALPVVDLPQPDSPTRPRVSPRRMSSETPDTACTVWRPAGKLTTRSSTRSSVSRGARRWAVPVPAIS
jgi:hypothetical protein